MASVGNHLLALWLLLAAIVAFSSAQSFSIEPQDTETIEGNRVVMTCRVNNRPAGALLYWQIPAITTRFIGPEYTVPAEYEDRYQVEGDPQLSDYNLVIKAASEEDEGIYKCILFESGSGNTGIATEFASSKEAHLTVAILDPSGVPDCWASPRREVHVGDRLSLHCASFDPNLDLEWTRDNTLLPSLFNASTPIPRLITTLLIADAAMNDAIFECISPSVNNRQCQVVLSVTSPPDVAITSMGDTKAGQDGRFQCTATGNPSVFVYKWKYNDKEIDYTYDPRFNMAILEDNSGVLVLPNMQTSDDAAILECTAINEHGEGSATFPIRVANNNTTSIIAWSFCAVIVAIILLLLVGFFYWRSQQRRKLAKIATARPDRSGPIDTEMNGHVNPTFTSFSPLEVDSVGYGPDVQPYQSKPSERVYDSGGPEPIPRKNSDVRSKGGESESDTDTKDVDNDEEEVTQTFTYQVNPNFEEYRTKASYDVTNDDDNAEGAYADVIKKPLPQNDLDLEKELVGELSMFSHYDRNFDQDSEPIVVSTEL